MTGRSLRNHQDTGAVMSGIEKIGEMSEHRVLVMRNDDAALNRSHVQNFRIGDSFEPCCKSALKVDGGFTSQHASPNRTAKVVIGLESGFHLLRAR